MDSKTNFQAFIGFLNKKIKENQKDLANKLKKSDSDYEEYSEAIINLFQQKKLIIDYKQNEN